MTATDSTVFTTGQPVRIAYNGQAIDGTVLLASTNGVSLMLSFDGALRTPSGGMVVAMLPVLREANGGFYDLVEGGETTIEARE